MLGLFFLQSRDRHLRARRDGLKGFGRVFLRVGVNAGDGLIECGRGQMESHRRHQQQSKKGSFHFHI